MILIFVALACGKSWALDFPKSVIKKLNSKDIQVELIKPSVAKVSRGSYSVNVERGDSATLFFVNKHEIDVRDFHNKTALTEAIEKALRHWSTEPVLEAEVA